MTLKGILKKIKAAESAISMILGITVVVVVGIMLFNYFRNYSVTSQRVKEGAQLSQEGGKGKIGSGERTTSLPAKYTVTAGDSLWKISEKFYGSGYNWVDVSRENKIGNPNQILRGQELTIPNVPAKKATVAQEKTAVKTAEGTPITGSRYTVVKGDTLWNISVRAYQDGFKWTQVAKANNLVHPSLIHPGNVLTIPR